MSKITTDILYTDAHGVFAQGHGGDQPPGPHSDYYVADQDIVNTLLLIDFQDGPVKHSGVNGVNGVQVEHLLAICAHRLRALAQGSVNNVYTNQAIVSIDKALFALACRESGRVASGTEGTHRP